MTSKRGAVDQAKTEKAGCGIRYNPEQLGDDTGFDFSAAAQQLETLDQPEQNEDNTAQQKDKTDLNSSPSEDA